MECARSYRIWPPPSRCNLPRRMTTLVALTVGLVAWIVLWALGAKPFDAFLVTLLILLPAAAWQIFGPGLKRLMGLTPPPS
jgi:hypothetical protein